MKIKSFVKYLPIFYIAALILLSLGHLIFAFRTNNYFSNDDFYVLAHLRVNSVGQMVIDFFLKGDLFGFRKIIGYFVFGVLFKSFGANPNVFIFTNFLLHTINLILLFTIVRSLTKKDFTAFFATVLFNKLYLFYFSNIHEYLGVSFCLFAVLMFLRFPKKIYLSLAAYILALFSKEITYTLPFLLLALSYINKTDKKKTIPFFVILAGYIIYQSFFVLNAKGLPSNYTYELLFSVNNLIKNLVFYFNPFLLVLFGVFPLLTKKYKPLFILGVSFLTLLPALFLANRREMYYLYLPITYILIYLSYYLPKLNLKTALIYVVILLLFGGRSVFPKVAWQIFPNIQKDSMGEVVGIVEKDLSSNPRTATINLRKVNIERDTWLMLNENVLDLFVSKDVSSKYSFTYVENLRTVYANRIQQI